MHRKHAARDQIRHLGSVGMQGGDHFGVGRPNFDSKSAKLLF